MPKLHLFCRVSGGVVCPTLPKTPSETSLIKMHRFLRAELCYLTFFSKKKIWINRWLRYYWSH